MLRIDRSHYEALGMSTLMLDAEIHREHGWDRMAWLELCCCRVNRVRQGRAIPDTIDQLTAQLARELPMVATFAFHPYPNWSQLS